MPSRSPENQEIVELLVKLKEQTQEYPADLLDARKHAYLKQIVDLKISREGGSDSGKGRPGGAVGPPASGAALSKGATFLGIPLKTALAIGAAILLLTAGYLFREQIVEYLAENGVIRTEETSAPPSGSTPDSPAQGTPPAIGMPGFGSSTTAGPATEVAPAPGNGGLPGTPGGTPAPAPPRGPAGFFQYLLCILRSGAENCR